MRGGPTCACQGWKKALGGVSGSVNSRDDRAVLMGGATVVREPSCQGFMGA